MKIKDNIERECCQISDLLPYNGEFADNLADKNLQFCKYCGQLFSLQSGNGHGTELSIKRIVAGKTE